VLAENILKNADFWMQQGYKVQSKITNDQDTKGLNSISLDYYLSGVRADPTHYGCTYNIACSYFKQANYLNAFKWFQIAIKLSPLSKECYYGKAVT
jgi:tetratricopeptide (TPR) repeat protein